MSSSEPLGCIPGAPSLVLCLPHAGGSVSPPWSHPYSGAVVLISSLSAHLLTELPGLGLMPQIQGGPRPCTLIDVEMSKPGGHDASSLYTCYPPVSWPVGVTHEEVTRIGEVWGTQRCHRGTQVQTYLTKSLHTALNPDPLEAAGGSSPLHPAFWLPRTASAFQLETVSAELGQLSPSGHGGWTTSVTADGGPSVPSPAQVT